MSNTSDDTDIAQAAKLKGESRRLAEEKPLGWRNLLFLRQLTINMATHEESYLDFEKGFALPIGPVLDEPSRLLGRQTELEPVYQQLEKLGPDLNGAVSDSGTVARIVWVAKRLSDIYGHLIDWANRIRATNVEEYAVEYRNALADLPTCQIVRFREVRDQLESTLVNFSARLEAGEKVSARFDLGCAPPQEAFERAIAAMRAMVEGYKEKVEEKKRLLQRMAEEDGDYR